MPKYSLVGYDSSDTSQRAFRFAMNLARACKGRVRVVSVLQVTQGGADACALMIPRARSAASGLGAHRRGLWSWFS